jgi:hypothetical protein
MIRRGVTGIFLALSMGLALILVTAVLIVDPYGVSPLRLSIPGFNLHKLKTVDIDRQSKPVRVLFQQPKTIFLGTSRVHWGLDPDVLADTALGPATNAALPAAFMGENLEYLRHLMPISWNLQTVFLELRFTTFLSPWGRGRESDVVDFWSRSLSLFVSLRAVWDCIGTAGRNFLDPQPHGHVGWNGFFYRSDSAYNSMSSFGRFPEGIWHAWEQSGGQLNYQSSAMDAVREAIALAKKNDIDLVFLLLPEHTYIDFWLDYLDMWPMMEKWLPEIAGQATVISLAQPNARTMEEPSTDMHWYDPNHFKPEIGRAIQLALAGRPTSDLPEDFMIRLTPQTAREHVERRRAASRAWQAAHPDFVSAVKAEYARHGVFNPKAGRP